MRYPVNKNKWIAGGGMRRTVLTVGIWWRHRVHAQTYINSGSDATHLTEQRENILRSGAAIPSTDLPSREKIYVKFNRKRCRSHRVASIYTGRRGNVARDRRRHSAWRWPNKLSSSMTQQFTLVASVPLSNESWIPFEENQLLVIKNGQIRNAE